MASRDTLKAIEKLKKNRGNLSVDETGSLSYKKDATTSSKTKTQTTETKYKSNSSAKSKKRVKAIENLMANRGTIKRSTFPTVANPATVGNSPVFEAYTSRIASDMTDAERTSRIKELKNELNTLKTKINGYSRASMYGTSSAMEEAKKRDNERIAELSTELKSLERVGTFSASELKQFEIDDAKAKKAALPTYNPTARINLSEADAFKENVKARSEIDKEINRLEREKAEYRKIERLNELNAHTEKITSKGDYEQSSKYAPLNPKTEDELKAEGYKQDAEGKWYRTYGFGYREGYTGEDSELYTYINDESKRLSLEADILLLSGVNTYRDSGYHTLTDEEKGAFNYLYHQDRKNGTKTADEYLKNISPLLQQRAMALEAQQYAKISKEAPVVMSALSLGTNLQNAAMFPAKIVATATGSYEDMPFLDVYGNRTQAIRGGVSEDMGTLGRLAYNAGMSIGDMGVAMAAGGGNAKVIQAIMSSSVGSSTISEAKNNGASDGKALVMGLGSAAIEWATEKYSVEAILKEPEKVLGFIATNTLTEATEEGASNVSNIALDAIVSEVFGERNEIEQRIDYLVLYKGKTEEEAMQIAFKEKLQSLGEDVLVGGLTGFGMSGAKASAIGLNNAITNKKTGDTYSVDTEAVIQKGLDSDPNSEAHEIATELKSKLDAGEKIYNVELGRAVIANEEEIQRENANNPATIEEAAEMATRETDRTGVNPDAPHWVGKLPTITETPVETAKAKARSAIGEVNDNTKSILGEGNRTVGVAGGQAFVTNGKDILPSRANRSVFLPVNDVETAKVELGATESNKTGENIAKILDSDFQPISEKIVDGNIEGVGEVRVFTTATDNARQIALTKDVAEYFEGYNLEATFRGGKPYAIKATDNDGNVAGVALAVWQNTSGIDYTITDAKPITQTTAPSVADTKKLTGFGEHGAQAFSDIVLKSKGDRLLLASEFNTAYQYGLLNANPSTIDSSSAVQVGAYKAGLQDYNVENATKKANVPNVISHGGKAGFDRTTAPEKVSKEAIDIVDKWAKELGVVARVVGKSDKYNAKLLENKGVVLIASDFTVDERLGEDAVSKSFVTHAMHELLDHRAEELAPEAYAEFKREMYLYKESKSNINLADAKRLSYAAKGEDISLSEAMSEVTANSIFELYDNDIDLLAEGFDRVMNGTNAKAKKGANAFLRALNYVIEKFNSVLDKLGVNEKARLKPVIDQTTKLRNLLEKTLSAAVAQSKKNAAKTTTENLEIKTNKEYNGSTKFALKDEKWHTDLTKAQFKKVEGWLEKEGGPEAKRITDTSYWYKGRLDGEDIFVIYSTEDPKGNTILYEVKGDQANFERNILIDVLEVQENGESINGKSKALNAVSSGGWMQQSGVVQNHDGSLGGTRSSEDASILQRQSQSKPTKAFVNVVENLLGKQGKVAPNSTNTKVRHSLKDSEGNTLTKEQQEYFKDSKVRDENGNLLVMYQGSQNDFTVFDRKKSKYSNLYGRGFYFTRSESYARQYGNTKAYYLDIKNPVSTTETTITKVQMRKFLEAVSDNEDYGIENYGYGATPDSVLNSLYGKTDFLMLNDVSQTAIGDLVEAVELFNKVNGTNFDGFILPTETVIFSSEQAKLTSNKSPTSNPDTRFSLKEPVEETKNLVALHNLTEEKLLKTLALGGFPMPSIAVTKSDIPHTNFGDITLVMSKDTIDPKANKKNTVYSADAWTPVVPSIEYEVNPEAESRLKSKFYDLSRKFGREAVDVMYSYGNTLEYQLNRDGGADGIIAKLKDDTRMMNVYLLDTGKEQVENVYKEKVSRLSDAEIEEFEFIINGLGEDVLNETYPAEGEAPLETRKKWLEAHGEDLEKVYADYLKSTGMMSESEVSELMSKVDFKANRLIRNVVLPARNYLKNGAETKTREYDSAATREAIKNAVNTKAYEKWLQDNFGDVEKSQGIYNNKDYYMPSGKRRSFAQTHYPVTLENIVKAMTGKNDGNTKNVSGFVGIKTLRAGTAERFKSIADMHKRSDRLQHLTEAEAEAINDALSKRMTDVMSCILETSKHPMSNSYIEIDSIGEILSEVAESGKYTIDSITKTFTKYEYNIGNAIATDIRDLLFDVSQMPVNIFEAKPERAVGFDEVLAAVLPDSASEKLRMQLEQAGVNVLTYEKGNDADRMAKVNSVEDATFSLKGTEKDVSLKDVEKVGKAIASKDAKALAKYAENGAISTEFYNQLIETYGVIPKGEKPARDVSVPKKTAEGKKVSQTVRTILEAKATPDEAVPTIEKMVEDGVFSYDVYTDKQAIADKELYLREHGWSQSYNDWLDAVNKGEVSKEQTVMGWALYNNAANIAATTTSETERREAITTSLIVLDAMVRHQRSAAQALQATRILKKMSPETQLYGVQKSVQAFQRELEERYGKKAPKLKVDEGLAEQFLTAKTDEERAKAEAEIYKDIGRQMPSRFIDQWNAWRYLAMLGNVKTHVRNVFGNLVFAPVVNVKNVIATGIESAVHKLSGNKTVRSKALLNSTSKVDRELISAAYADFANATGMISNGGKYSDFAMANQQIEKGRQIFKSKPLEAARKGNSKLLEKEDMLFAKPHYAYALASYCKANNITAEQLSRGKALGAARQYAIKEAQKATYRDTNAISHLLSRRFNENGEYKGIAKLANMAVDGIVPFRKTPANILARGLEFSPLGLLNGIKQAVWDVQRGKKTSAEAIDSISAGLTGTGLLLLGVLLSKFELVRGHGEDDEEEKKFKEMMGHQAYSLELPNGTSVTLDWLAPEALPFFVGVNIWETAKDKDKEVTLSTLLQTLTAITEPMLEMSCLQGINDMVESFGYASANDTSGITALLSSAATSYLTQSIPTLAGQIERTSEENRMTTYTEKNSFLTKDMQYTLGKWSAKLPIGWDYNQIPYIDAWGRKEASGTALERGLNNFLNPAYTSTIETSSMEKELLRLYEKTGEDGVFPERADKYFMVDGVRKDLTKEEYVRYATLKGEKSHKVVSDLVKSKAYKNLSNEEKVKAIEEAYDYANQKAKEAISKYKPETWVKNADGFGSSVGNYLSFKAEVASTREANGDKISKQEVVDIILDMAQNDTETWNMYMSMFDSTGANYAKKNGVDGGKYVEFIDTLDKVDKPNENGNLGTYTNDEITEAIRNVPGISNKDRAILWQSFKVGKSSKNNPWRRYLP